MMEDEEDGEKPRTWTLEENGVCEQCEKPLTAIISIAATEIYRGDHNRRIIKFWQCQTRECCNLGELFVTGI